MKTFPIKVERAAKTNLKFIEWKIHNVCNNDCSFCGSIHKDGSERWLTLEEYKEHVDLLANECNGEPFWFQLTGGEPTLFPELAELLRYMKHKNAYISLISNGSRTLRWWKELKEENLLDYLFLTYHSEQTTDYKHITDVINVFHDAPIRVVCLVTHVIGTIELAFEGADYIVENTGAVINLKSMVIGDYDIYQLYSPEQITKLKSLSIQEGKLRSSKARPAVIPAHRFYHNLKITNNDGTIKRIEPQLLMKNQENYFQGWECDIGRNNMRIDRDAVYSGVCGVGGKRKLSYENLSFTTDFIRCTSPECFCGTDMVATKIRPIEMYPKDK
jgi:organic radical activating enzyme